MSWLWSAKNNAFFHDSKLDSYSDIDLSDSVSVSDDVFDEFSISPNHEYKVRGVAEDGMPCWLNPAPPSPSELAEQAEATKFALQREAEDAIKPLERAKQLGIATEAELALLLEWEKYSVFLMRVDTSTAPDIAWPQKP